MAETKVNIRLVQAEYGAERESARQMHFYQSLIPLSQVSSGPELSEFVPPLCCRIQHMHENFNCYFDNMKTQQLDTKYSLFLS